MKDKRIVISTGGWCIPLLVVFITLKLTGTIAWSWWWVLSPLWLPVALVAGIFAAILVGGGIVLGVAALVAWALD